MKKLFVLSTIVALIFVFACNPAKKTTSTSSTTPEVARTTYDNGLQTVIMANCSPCHIPAKGGNKKPYDNYANAKTDIDEMIRRMELNPSERGFMPFRKGAKLSDSTIAVFKKWRDDGLLEK
ncbi:MAG: hypothetical protein ABIR30_05815 [Chitinophagaceae bacterium]